MLEIMGAGMVHPNVLRAAGVDPYPARVGPRTPVAEVRRRFEEQSAEALEAEARPDTVVFTAGDNVGYSDAVISSYTCKVLEERGIRSDPVLEVLLGLVHE